MPGKLLVPFAPKTSTQIGIPETPLYSGSKFQGHQKSKGNRYDVEVVFQVIQQFVIQTIDTQIPLLNDFG